MKTGSIKILLSLLALLLCFMTATACSNAPLPPDDGNDVVKDDNSDTPQEELKWPGNAARYSVENTPALADSAIGGLTVFWLGSSVTYGSASEGESVADYVAKRNGGTAVKEAVSGTTLRKQEGRTNSYVERLEKGALQTGGSPDLFVCQLSTNDVGNSTGKFGLPTDGDVFDRSEFDLFTTCGAIEYIVSYVRETWNCPIAFWSNPKYSSTYGILVDRMRVIAEKWDIGFWNMYDDEPLPEDGSEDYKLYMTDRIHPSRAGYREWWTPYFEAKIAAILSSGHS